jgi:hypothetical protein
MDQKKSSAQSWLILGAVFILLLFVYAYIGKYTSLRFSRGVDSLVSAVFGFGGAVFLLVGIVKAIIGHFKK